MLDNFTIVHRSGVVLWSKTYDPKLSASSPIGPLIKTALIESRSDETRFDEGKYCCRWTLANEYGLAFIAVYQRITHLAYVPALLERVRELFLQLFEGVLSAGRGSGGLFKNNAVLTDLSSALKDWEKVFTSTLRQFEKAAGANARAAIKGNNGREAAPAADPSVDASAAATNPTTSTAPPASDAAAIAKSIEAFKAKHKGLAPGRRATGGTGGGNTPRSASGTATPSDAAGGGTSTPKKKAGAGKDMRKWDADGNAISVGDAGVLDYSNATNAGDVDGADDTTAAGSLAGWIDEKSMGRVGADGVYEVADALDGEGGDEGEEEDDDEDDESGNSAAAAKPASRGWLASLSGGSSSASSLLSRLTGSSGHPLTSADLQPTLSAMQSHLQSKNVAADVAQRLCASVGRSLEGKTLSGSQAKKAVRAALQEAIVRILTPRNSTDLMLEINDKLQRQRGGSGGGGGADAAAARQPYTLAFVGVNGVGKSTNLAKVCFWLLQNQKRVLIAACDTFRSGAVEQLRVHVRNLGELQVGGAKVKDPAADGGNKLELFERGYGKDASGICSAALAYARTAGFDVVLIDTAGRMQDNEPLMRSLAKLVAVNEPDRVIFVGEALVGNEAVDQLTRFDRSLKDFSGKAVNARGLDGMLLTKFDTVDGKVGTALTATSVTGLPIYFVGVGQTYTDLKQLRVGRIVDALMRD